MKKQSKTTKQTKQRRELTPQVYCNCCHLHILFFISLSFVFCFSSFLHLNYRYIIKTQSSGMLFSVMWRVFFKGCMFMESYFYFSLWALLSPLMVESRHVLMYTEEVLWDPGRKGHSASDHPEGLPSPGHVLKILALYFHYYKMLWSNQE